MRHRKLRPLGVLLLSGMATTAGGDEPALKSVNCTPLGEIRGDASRGEALHLKNCAECHGVDGKAEVIVLHMDTPPKDQSDPAYMKTLPDAYLYLAICKGGLGVGKNFIMPAWGDLLSDQDIKDLVAQIRTFSGT
ncbi:MAG: c-type cytochrome [Gammaproteobacteria bacterium]|nr:c-type cytochrome [Gammaproteobacteria bacterium]